MTTKDRLVDERPCGQLESTLTTYCWCLWSVAGEHPSTAEKQQVLPRQLQLMRPPTSADHGDQMYLGAQGRAETHLMSCVSARGDCLAMLLGADPCPRQLLSSGRSSNDVLQPSWHFPQLVLLLLLLRQRRLPPLMRRWGRFRRCCLHGDGGCWTHGEDGRLEPAASAVL